MGRAEDAGALPLVGPLHVHRVHNDGLASHSSHAQTIGELTSALPRRLRLWGSWNRHSHTRIPEGHGDTISLAALRLPHPRQRMPSPKLHSTLYLEPPS